MDNNVVIEARNLSKKYRLFDSPTDRIKEALHPYGKLYHEEFWALSDVSFSILAGQTTGILGRNGSGKSTLLQIIASLLQPTEGEVEVNGRVSALLELGAGFDSEFTGRENVMLSGALMGFSEREMEARLPEIEAFADIGDYFRRPVKTYSTGMFARVAFSVAIHVDPEILIVDEALAVGDAKFQERCYQKFSEYKQAGKSILFVTHDVYLVPRLCDQALVLNDGRLCFAGAAKEAVNVYQNILFGPSDETTVSGEEKNISKAAENADAASLGLSDQFENRRSYNKYERRLGNKKAEIIDYLFVEDDIVDPNYISGETQLKIYMHVYFNDDVYDYSVGFAVLNKEGVMVYGTNTQILGIDIGTATKGDTKTFCFDISLRLSGGEFFFNLGCDEYIQDDHIYLDVRRSCCHLSVAETPWCTGVVDLELDFKVVA